MKQKGPRISLVVESVPGVDEAFVLLKDWTPEPSETPNP